MKQSTAALFALILSATLLSACSQEDTTISIENPPAELGEANEDADTTADNTADNTADDAADAEEKDSDEDGEEEGDEDGEDKQSDTEGTEQQNVKLEVSSQQSYGQIKVAKVSTSRDGWLSVHRSKEDGSIVLPEGIGEARVDSGDSEDVIIDLWEATEVDEKLWVLLHVDSGERGKYEFPEKDAPVKRNGEMMARSLTIKGEEKGEEKDEDAAE